MLNCKQLIDKHLVFKLIGEVADKLELTTYVVGGFVRDLFLNRPSHDIDIVCVGNSLQLAKALANTIDSTKPVIFKNFGTAKIQWQGWDIEFVSARKESYVLHSRNPVVSYGSLEDDQNRRDFTINSMAICLNQQQYGILKDPFYGIEDLKQKIIKTPCNPEQTFSDDPLRMLRAIRFATQLNFTIAIGTLEAIQKNVNRIKIISKERIKDELNKIIATDTPSYGFKLLFHAKLLNIIFPELVMLQGIEVIDGQSHKDNFYHTLKVLDNVAKYNNNIWLRWAAVLHDIAKPITKKFDSKIGFTFHNHEELGAHMIPKIFRKMSFPLNENMKYVQKLVRLHRRPIALAQQVTDTAIRRLIYEVGDDLKDLMLLCRADITSKNESKIQQFLQNFDKVEERIADVEERDQVRNFQPVITGEVIMKTFGIKPSRIVGTLKYEIKEAILEGEISNEYEEAYQFMLSLGKKHHLL